MHIVFAVTIVALGRRIAKLLASRMAGHALFLGFLVGVFQWEFGATVIELAFVQFHDARVSPLVLRMTNTALGIGNTAMVVVAITYVGGRFLVTIKAKLGLRRLVEPLVALGAFGFPLGMPGDYFSGGEHVVNGLSRHERR
jgi:hypothetical protein